MLELYVEDPGEGLVKQKEERIKEEILRGVRGTGKIVQIN